MKDIHLLFGIGVLLFFACIAQTLVGGIFGWVVDLVFPFVVPTINTVAGTSLTGFEAGAVLGFIGSVGSFFRISVTKRTT